MKYTPQVSITQRECAECGKKFFPAMEANIYCSDDCRIASNHRKSREAARKRWEDNPRYCALCGNIVPFGRRTYCSQKCQLDMKKRMSANKTEPIANRKVQKKEPGVEGLAKDLGISYGQYRATGGKKPEDIAEKYNAPAYSQNTWLGDKTIEIGEKPPKIAPAARIKRRVK